MRWRLLFAYCIGLVICTILFTANASAIGTRQALWGEEVQGSTTSSREPRGEYYYWDGNELHAASGQFTSPVTFKEDGGKYVPSGPIDFLPDGIEHDGSKEAECGTKIPLNKLNLEIRQEGDGLRADIIGDGSGGTNMGSGEIKWGVSKTIGSVTYNAECKYMFFDHFRSTISAYGNNRLTKDVASGKVFGKKGMPFAEWVKRSDRANVYAALQVSAATNIDERCSRKDDKVICNARLWFAYDKCAAEAVGVPGGVVDVNSVDHKAWEKDFDTGKLVECLKKDKSIEKYLPPDEVEDFVKEIIDEADIPPSVKPNTPDASGKSGENGDPASTTCSIYRVGWIMCPFFSFIAKMNDTLFGILKNWLVLAPFQSKVGSTNSAAYDAWINLRNIANVLFIIFFIIMIFTMMTSYGNQSYGLKKAIPKLIIVAVLVNLSFTICSIGNDLANIAGDSLFKITKELPATGTAKNGIGMFEKVTTNVILTGGAAALSVGVLANLSALIPILIGATFAFVMTIFILTIRQVVIILLVVISPVAFTMLLLPNTKKWFDRWRSMLISLLLIYPAIALIFGGSFFASNAVGATAATNGQTLLNIMSLGILILPLFVAPILLKLGGGLMNRFGGIINNPQKGLKDRSIKAAQQFRQDRKLINSTKGMQGRMTPYGIGSRMMARRRTKTNFRKSEEADAWSRRQGRGKDRLMTSFTAGGMANRGVRNSVDAQIAHAFDKAEREDMHIKSLLLDDSEQVVKLGDMVDDAINGYGSPGGLDQAGRLARYQKAFNAKDVGEVNKILEHVNDMSDFERKVVSELITTSGVQSVAPHLDQTAATKVARNEYQGSANPLHQMYQDSLHNGNFTPEATAHASPSAIAGIGAAQTAGAVSTADVAQVKASFGRAEINHELSQHILGGTRTEVGRL